MDAQAKLNEGREHHQAGRFGDAGRCYKAVLEAEPDNVDALHLMSVLSQMAGDNQTAFTLAARAIHRQPDWYPPYVALGNALQAAGQTEQAAQVFQQALALSPGSPEPYINLASALNDLGRFAEASRVVVEAIVIDASIPEAHNIFGNVLSGLDSPEEAIEAYQKAVYLKPDWDAPWYNIGVALAAQGKHDEALATYRRSISLADGAAKRFNLANSLVALGRTREAEEEYRQALAQDPDYVDAYNNLGTLLKDMERLDEAETCLTQALRRSPDSADLHWNLSLVHLMRGQWGPGWTHYEWRWQMPTFLPFKRDFGKPEWQGEDVAGRTILVSAEQGFGDAIQFCRLASLLAARGARVVLECRKGLKRLFTTLEGIGQVVSPGDEYGAFDLVVPLMSLPRTLGLELGDLPAFRPYVSVPEGAADFSDVAALGGLKVGLVWGGGASRRDNLQRSCRALDFLPLLDVAGCRFFSLQVGPLADQVTDLPGVIDLAPRLGDFADTAAALSALDVLVSVDTGVVHLAGALGRRTRVLLSKPSNGFLWMQDRADSPWYGPDLRLVRQAVSGDWAGVVARVRDELQALSASA